MDSTVFRDSFQFVRYRFDRPHYTDNRRGACPHYFGFMRKGRARLVAADREISVCEGDLFYIPCGLSYQSYWAGDPEVCFDSYALAFLPEGEERHPLQKIPLTPTLTDLLDRLGSAELTTDSRTLGLFFLLFSEVRGQMETCALGRAHTVVATALAHMEALDRLDVPALARHCRVSESGLFAAFRAARNTTPLACFHRLQAERAVHLLTATDLSVEEISARLGFCSPAYFRRILRRELGKTPREIRKSGTPKSI